VKPLYAQRVFVWEESIKVKILIENRVARKVASLRVLPGVWPALILSLFFALFASFHGVLFPEPPNTEASETMTSSGERNCNITLEECVKSDSNRCIELTKERGQQWPLLIRKVPSIHVILHMESDSNRCIELTKKEASAGRF